MPGLKRSLMKKIVNPLNRIEGVGSVGPGWSPGQKGLH